MNQFITRLGDLDANDRANYNKLLSFVTGFSIINRVDKAVRLLYNEEEEPYVEAQYFSCREIVDCGLAEEAMILLGTCCFLGYIYV